MLRNGFSLSIPAHKEMLEERIPNVDKCARPFVATALFSYVHVPPIVHMTRQPAMRSCPTFPRFFGGFKKAFGMTGTPANLGKKPRQLNPVITVACAHVFQNLCVYLCVCMCDCSLCMPTAKHLCCDAWVPPAIVFLNFEMQFRV